MMCSTELGKDMSLTGGHVLLLILFRVINEIFEKVDDHIQKESLITDLNMSALPSLYKQFVQLIEYLVNSANFIFYVSVIIR